MVVLQVGPVDLCWLPQHPEYFVHLPTSRSGTAKHWLLPRNRLAREPHLVSLKGVAALLLLFPLHHSTCGTNQPVGNDTAAGGGLSLCWRQEPAWLAHPLPANPNLPTLQHPIGIPLRWFPPMPDDTRHETGVPAGHRSTTDRQLHQGNKTIANLVLFHARWQLAGSCCNDDPVSIKPVHRAMPPYHCRPGLPGMPDQIPNTSHSLDDTSRLQVPAWKAMGFLGESGCRAKPGTGVSLL